MKEERIKWDIEVREIDNGLIVVVEKQGGMVFYKFYCKDTAEALEELKKKLLGKTASK